MTRLFDAARTAALSDGRQVPGFYLSGDEVLRRSADGRVALDLGSRIAWVGGVEVKFVEGGKPWDLPEAEAEALREYVEAMLREYVEAVSRREARRRWGRRMAAGEVIRSLPTWGGES